MNRAVWGVAGALCLVGCMAVIGLVWPMASGYLAVLHSRDSAITDTRTIYDRTPLLGELAGRGFALGDAAHVRIFKRERVVELWVRHGSRFVLFKSYPICTYSGGLGPKLAEGDRQAPEGFYRVAQKQLNPASRHHLAFNLGFPNAFDQQLARTGSALMVHGGCSSVGCYAVGDAQVDEIYAVVEAALQRGQPDVDVAIFPFRMTDAALAAEAGNAWLPFWQNLKQGSDLFDATGAPPPVGACRGVYRFGADALAADLYADHRVGVMDRVISLLAALVGLIALGGAILVHVNADTQRAEMAAEIAQIKASVGLPGAPVQVANATAAPVSSHIPSAEHLTPSLPQPSSATPVESAVAVAEPSAAAAAPPSVSASEPAPASSLPPLSSAPPPVVDVATQLAAMQTRIAELEKANTAQASQLAAAQAQLTSHAPSPVASSSAPGAAADSGGSGDEPAVHADPTVPASVLAADGPTKDCIPLGTRFMGAAGDSFPLCRTRMVLKVAVVSDGIATITGPGDVTAGATVPYGKGCVLAVFSADSGYAEMRVSCQ